MTFGEHVAHSEPPSARRFAGTLLRRHWLQGSFDRAQFSQMARAVPAKRQGRTWPQLVQVPLRSFIRHVRQRSPSGRSEPICFVRPHREHVPKFCGRRFTQLMQRRVPSTMIRDVIDGCEHESHGAMFARLLHLSQVRSPSNFSVRGTWREQWPHARTGRIAPTDLTRSYIVPKFALPN